MLFDHDIRSLRAMLEKEEISIAGLAAASIDQSQKIQNKYNPFTFLRPEKEILQEAKKLQQHFSSSKPLLYGMPFVLKDSYSTKGIPTTAGSRVLESYMAPYNSTVFQKLIDQGALLVGKTNMDAWGHGASTENTDFGPTQNPYDPTRTPGGSTGGTAVAVACRAVAFGIGEDTGGSIRNPSGHTNITGLKVTYGRVSRYGCIAYASSFDTVGPMAKTAADCAIVLEAIAGIDPLDATSSPYPIDSYSDISISIEKKYTIGLPLQTTTQSLNQEVKSVIDDVKSTIEALGHTVVHIDMPELLLGLPVYYLIGPSETSSNLARMDGIRFGRSRNYFTLETMRRIMTGTYALSAGYYDQYYRKAQKVRTMLVTAYEKAFSQCDVLLMPISPTPPPKLGETISDPVTNMLSDIFTITHNIVGIPSLALPGGFTKSELPIGFQLAGPMFSEKKLLDLGHQFQSHTKWHLRSPEAI